MKLLKELSEAAGVPGREENIRTIVRRELKGHIDEISEDAMGNIIAVKKGSAKSPKKVMFAAHMDEIGFYVRFIDDEGFLRVQNAGGFDTRNLFARRVIVHTSKGPIDGIMNPSGKPIHMSLPEDLKKYLEISEFYVDVGMPGEHVKKQVCVGDPITINAPYVEFGNYLSGKCFDDRAQVWIGIRTLQKIKNPKNDVYGVFTVQEEVGLRGAFTSAYGVNPDVGVALDTTLACDTPGVSADQHITKLGAGVGIKIMDGASISDRGLVDEFVAVAEKNKIPYQLEILPRGGTDAGAIQRARAGVRAITLSIPTRYIHTVTETIHRKDLDAGLNLLVKYLEK